MQDMKVKVSLQNIDKHIQWPLPCDLALATLFLTRAGLQGCFTFEPTPAPLGTPGPLLEMEEG